MVRAAGFFFKKKTVPIGPLAGLVGRAERGDGTRLVNLSIRCPFPGAQLASD